MHNNKSSLFQGFILRHQYIGYNEQALDEMTEEEYNANVSRIYNKTSYQYKPVVSPLHHVLSTTSVVSMGDREQQLLN